MNFQNQQSGKQQGFGEETKNLVGMYGDLLKAYSMRLPHIDATRDKKRIDVLLEINTVLLEKCIPLQSYVMNKANTNAVDYMQKKIMYQNYLKRIHLNLMCLASINDIHSGNGNEPRKNYVLPQIVLPPQELPGLTEYYKSLDQLYPEAIPLFQKRMEVMAQQRRQKRQGGSLHPKQVMTGQVASASQQQRQPQEQIQGDNMTQANGMQGLSSVQQAQRQFNAFKLQRMQQTQMQGNNGSLSQQPQQQQQLFRHLQQQQQQQRRKSSSTINGQEFVNYGGNTGIPQGNQQLIQSTLSQLQTPQGLNTPLQQQPLGPVQPQSQPQQSYRFLSEVFQPNNPGSTQPVEQQNPQNGGVAETAIVSPEQILAKVNGSSSGSDIGNGLDGNLLNGW